MKILKKAAAYILALSTLVSAIPPAFAESDEVYKISNNYMSFSYNEKTGGFAIETAEGNPQKLLDDNIPLLYAEDKERSNGTSFITVKMGERDYIFGQDYGFFGLNSETGQIKISEEGRLIEIPWTIDGVTVTLKAALDNNEESATTGNVGLSFEVKNNGESDKNVSVRLLLDTALGSKIDAPYFIVDTEKQATLTETEFKGENVPVQIRSVDSLSNPTMLSYILMQADGWNGGERPDRVILGHWANMANTRYAYTPDEYCDFSNYSNDYREPDSAASLYWENKVLSGGAGFTCEVLYGVGNFSNATDTPMGINMTITNRIELSEDGAAYKNDGKFELIVDIDNTVDNSAELADVVINLVTDDEKFELLDGSAQESYTSMGKEIKTLKYSLKALPQDDLCAGTLYISVTGDKILSDGSLESFETAAERSMVLPSVGEISEVQLNKINPEIVYTEGDKVITVSGKMKPLEAVLANDAKVDLKLIHTTTGDEVSIAKNKIAFLDENCEALTFTTGEALEVGEYEIVFEINDSILKEQLKSDTIKCGKTLRVSADTKYRTKSYGMIALVRTTEGKNTDYDFYTFGTENAFLKFYNGEAAATGEYNKKKIEYDFGEDEDSIKKHEVLLTVRANLREAENPQTGEKFWQADFADGNIILNNMLSYEGDSPLKIRKSGKEYIVEGDGLLKVINSINVWRSEWSISAEKSDVYTLDTERAAEAIDDDNISLEELTLKLGGAASMIQSIGGFAVDLKYGVLSSQWYDNSDGMVTYGIGFGGSISLPIKAKSKSEKDDSSSSGASSAETNVVTVQAFAEADDLTNRESDLEECLTRAFGAELADQYLSGETSEELRRYNIGTEGDEGTGTSTSARPETVAQTASTGDKISKDSNKLPKGKLTASVDNVLFGEKGEVKDEKVTVNDTGFVGIDATLSVELPEDLLGSLVSNAPGLTASVTINTIKNEYEINAALKMKVIECEGVLAFKQVKVKNKDTILPDKIEFYIRDGLKLPIAAPVLYMTGLGGGINELADTIGGEFDKLPPITILLFARLEAIETLVGDFNAKINLEGLSLTGEVKLKEESLEKVLNINAGIEARWVEPWELSLYGNVNIIDGLIKGGITVTIADDYFYGYVCASLCIPDSIPLVGGKELRGIEAAVSHEFIGTNIKIIGIKFGVIYYWGEKVSFGTNIDLSAPERNTYALRSIATDTQNENAVGYYGTNVHALSVTALASAAVSGEFDREVPVRVDNAGGQNALLLEIPYTGAEPDIVDFKIVNPDGKEAELTADDGNGGGSVLIQRRDDGDYIYATVTEADLIKNGVWTVKYKSGKGFEIKTFGMNGVDEIAEIESAAITLGTANASNETKAYVSWKINNAKPGAKGTIDVYLTEDKDILSKIQTSKNTGDTLGTNIYHAENADLSVTNAEITLPDALANGKYYAVATLSGNDGITLAISDNAVNFVNPNLPKDAESVSVHYGGDGELFVSVTDPEAADYTHYLAEIVAEDGTTLENNITQFEKGTNATFGKEAGLEAGKSYRVNVKTLREEYKKSGGEYKKHYYYGNATVSSDSIEMPEISKPKLESVKVNFDTSGEDINTNTGNVIIEYTFENDVFVELDLNDGKIYAFGVDPAPNDKSTYFRKNWKFVLDNLEDGDYVADFTAYTDKKDSIRGSEITDVENACFAFTVDTSEPVLSLAQKSVTGADGTAVVFAANTVIADKDGKYQINGITEKTARLTLNGEVIDGNTPGVTIAENGSFTIEKTFGKDENAKSHLITATDKAGNVAQMTVWAVTEDGFSFDGIEIYSDGKPIATDSEGVKRITLKNGDTEKISAYVLSGDKKIAVDNSEIEWSVLYAKNKLDLSNGAIEALSPGETAIKAKLATVSRTNGAEKHTDGLSDYVIINIENNSKSDLVDKITEAKNTLAANQNASESKKNALLAAIEEAETLVGDNTATSEDFTNGVTKLNRAIADFKKTDSTGGGSSGGGGGISATYYTVTATDSEHGKIELSQTRVKSGNGVTITAVPDEGYVVADMLINGKSVGRTEVYTIGAVKENINVEVIFAEKSDLPFTDVLTTDWYYPFVKSAYEDKYMAGMSETKFEPETHVSRAMFVAVLHRIDGEKIEGENKFADVAENAYYKAAVAWASANEIVKGTSETTFSPDESITREQAAAILYRYAVYKGADVSVGENTNILSYEDFDDISEYAISAMQYTCGSGLIVGKSDTTLNPKDTATRAEAATIFSKLAELIK